MQKLLNTLFVLSEDVYLTLDGENVVILREWENGAVFLNEAGRKTVLSAWQTRKREVVTHPFLKEKISWGQIPYVQALLLARFLRGDLEAYPPFLWR